LSTIYDTWNILSDRNSDFCRLQNIFILKCYLMHAFHKRPYSTQTSSSPTQIQFWPQYPQCHSPYLPPNGLTPFTIPKYFKACILLWSEAVCGWKRYVWKPCSDLNNKEKNHNWTVSWQNSNPLYGRDSD